MISKGTASLEAKVYSELQDAILMGRFKKGEALTVGPGEICLFRPHEPQIYNVGQKPTDFFWIHFSGSEAGRMLSFFEKRIYHIGAFPVFEEYCRDLVNALHTDKAYTDMLCEGRLITLFAHVAERILHGEKAHSDFLKIREALGLMRAEYQKRRTNTELARIAGMSRDCFEKTFKRVMGSTPRHYYALLIIQKAQDLLLSSTYSIGEISRLCGIEDPLYFSRLFKKHTGMPPAAYRKAFG